MSALDLISNQTCIRFLQLFPGRINEKAYVRIKAGEGCASEVGYREGEIHMSLNIEVCGVIINDASWQLSFSRQGCLDKGLFYHDQIALKLTRLKPFLPQEEFCMSFYTFWDFIICLYPRVNFSLHMHT